MTSTGATGFGPDLGDACAGRLAVHVQVPTSVSHLRVPVAAGAGAGAGACLPPAACPSGAADMGLRLDR